MRCIFTLVILFFSTETLYTQIFTWDTLLPAQQYKSKLYKDSFGNVYALNHKDNAQNVVKMNHQGKSLWKISFPEHTYLVSVAPASDSAVYFAGNFNGTVTLEDSTFVGNGIYNAWVAKYSDSGKFLWLKMITKGAVLIGSICSSGDHLIITGTATDTLSFFGTSVPKNNTADLFVARVTKNGTLDQIKFSSESNNTEENIYASGNECTTDAHGNTYVLATFSGIHKIDTFKVGGLVKDKEYPSITRALIKFDPNLVAKYVTTILYCNYNCDGIYGLTTTKPGECFLLQSRHYGGSGADILESKIIKINSIGNWAGAYQPRPDRKNWLFDIDADECSNIYFTGYCRNRIYEPKVYYGLLIGQVSSHLNQQWIRIDSAQFMGREGEAVAAISTNSLMVSGHFEDSLQLYTNHVVNTPMQFIATIVNQKESPCNMVSVPDQKQINSPVAFFPNPCTNSVKIIGQESDLIVTIYSLDGHIICEVNSPDGTCSINTSSYPPGIYVAKVRGNTTRESVKFAVFH
jgi:hypothetical protein